MCLVGLLMKKMAHVYFIMAVYGYIKQIFFLLIESFYLFQGSASATKGDFLLSSEHLIEIITKLHRTGATAADREELNIDISDE